MDSLGGVFPLSPALRQQIVKVYGGKRSQLIIRKLSVQQQVGAKDCGLFAVAFAVEVCHGNDPSRLSYDQSKLRSHFTSCFQKGPLDTFPQGRIESPRRIFLAQRASQSQFLGWLNQHVGVEAAARDDSH
jgi:hypothetical protein